MVDNTWSLVKERRFDEALQEYSRRYRESGNVVDLTNMGIVLLNLGRFSDANQAFETVVGLKSDNDASYLWWGTTQWLLGKREDAIKTWKNGLNRNYTDAAGGVQLGGCCCTQPQKRMTGTSRRHACGCFERDGSLTFCLPGRHLLQVYTWDS
jgi:tetratricopeptide (TPR) repeat protein